MQSAGEQGGRFLSTGIDADYFPLYNRHMAKKHTQSDTRLEVRLNPAVAERLKDTAKETGISLNQLMVSICTWTAENLHAGKPEVINDTLVFNQPGDGMFWIGQESDEKEQDEGEVYAIFDFSTHRTIRHPREYFHAQENPFG